MENIFIKIVTDQIYFFSTRLIHLMVLEVSLTHSIV